jgi:hypothetical protein
VDEIHRFNRAQQDGFLPFVENGTVTAKGLALLKEKVPHVSLGDFEKDPQVTKLSGLFTVKSLSDFVQKKLAA